MWPDASLTKDIAMFNQWKAAFEADYPEYEIIADPYTYNQETFISKATSGTLPTVFQTYFTEPQKLIKNNFIREITLALQELGWYDKMDPTMRETLSSGGKVYGVPRDGYGMGLFLNLAMLYDVGVIEKNNDGSYKLYDDNGDPLYPTTFEDIYNVSELIVNGFDNAYGVVVLSADKNGGWQFSNMAWNFGCEALEVRSQDGSWTANLNDAGAVEALKWIQKMRQDELISPDASLSYADWYSKVGSGQAAMAFAGSDALALPVTNFNFNKDDIAFVPMPTGDGTSKHALFGGTPYVFSKKATDEQV
jgi:ABC-type glycerol-3-phosphate transport system substrate-binding protein